MSLDHEITVTIAYDGGPSVQHVVKVGNIEECLRQPPYCGLHPEDELPSLLEASLCHSLLRKGMCDFLALPPGELLVLLKRLIAKIKESSK